MRNWIEFTRLESQKYDYKKQEFVKFDKPRHVPQLGSFANISFDGRYSLQTIINLCLDYLNKHKIDNYSGFIIHNNEWLKENKVYQYKKDLN